MVKMIGPPAFIVGFALAVIAAGLIAAGIMQTNPVVPLVVACMGVIVGLLNIADKEVNGFLLATIAFTVAAGGLGMVFGQLPGFTLAAPVFFGYIATFSGTAAGVVAFKQIWLLAKD